MRAPSAATCASVRRWRPANASKSAGAPMRYFAAATLLAPAPADGSRRSTRDRRCRCRSRPSPAAWSTPAAWRSRASPRTPRCRDTRKDAADHRPCGRPPRTPSSRSRRARARATRAHRRRHGRCRGRGTPAAAPTRRNRTPHRRRRPAPGTAAETPRRHRPAGCRWTRRPRDHRRTRARTHCAAMPCRPAGRRARSPDRPHTGRASRGTPRCAVRRHPADACALPRRVRFRPWFRPCPVPGCPVCPVCPGVRVVPSRSLAAAPARA